MSEKINYCHEEKNYICYAESQKDCKYFKESIKENKCCFCASTINEIFGNYCNNEEAQDSINEE